MLKLILANTGLPFTTFMMGLPIAASIATLGLGGIGIVFLETLGLRQQESVSWQQAFWASVQVNLFSTLMGFGFTFAYTASGLLILLGINVGLLSWFLSQLLLRLLAERQGSPQRLFMQVLIYLISFVVSLAIFMVAASLNLGIGTIVTLTRSPQDPLNSFIIATLGLLSLNFLLTWILESYALTGKWKKKSPVKLCRTVFWLNVRSYVYILLPILVLRGLIERQLDYLYIPSF